MAGERFGSVLTGRSTALQVNRAFSFGSDRFGPILTLFNRGPNPNSLPIKSFGPVPNKIPEIGKDSGPKPEVIFLGRIRGGISETPSEISQRSIVSQTIRFAPPEDKAKPNIQQFPEVKATQPAEQPQPSEARMTQKKTVVISTERETARPQHLLELQILSRLRRNLASVRTLRAQQKTAASPDIQSVEQSQALVQANTTSKEMAELPLPADVNKRIVPEKSKTTISIKKRLVERPAQELNELGQLRRSYITQDARANSLRLRVLLRSFDELKVLNGSDEIEGQVLAERSLIGSARSLRSRLLDQRGYMDREDGSQKRIEMTLNSAPSIGRSRLEELVEENTAVEATDQRPAKLATAEQVVKVLTPPNSPVTDSEPVVSEEIITTAQNNGSLNSADLRPQVVPVEESPKAEPLEIVVPQQEVLENIVAITTRLFDSAVRNIGTDKFDEISERSQLLNL